MPEATINGKRISFHQDDTILAAARRSGIDIPTLCHVEGLRPEGGCRLCLVDVKQLGLKAACHTPISPDSVIVTQTQELRQMRRWILELLLEQRNVSDVLSDSVFARLCHEHGINITTTDRRHFDGYLGFDPKACIVCRKCMVACDLIQGQNCYSVQNRGGLTQLALGVNDGFTGSPCTYCGACAPLCPTGAIVDINLPHDVSVDSVCGYCGVGCRVRVGVNDGQIAAIDGITDAMVNRGHLCAKGHYARQYVSSPDRLTTPLLRDGDDFKPISWTRAIEVLADEIRKAKSEHGPNSLAILTSSRATNESAYLAQKLFRSIIGTNNVDCCARVCHSSTALALRTVTGTGAASASYQDIERATCIVVAGANPTEAHPVVGARIKQAVKRGARLIVIDPRAIELTQFADVHLWLKPGTNVSLLNVLAKILWDAQQVDQAYLDEKVEGTEAFSAHLDSVDLSDVAQTTGVSLDDLHSAAALLKGPTLFVHGLGLSELTQGTESVMALCNLGMLTGSIGRSGAGMLPLRGQNNVQGNADMGGMPNLFTGYQPMDDPEVRHRLANLWGSLPPAQPGLKSPEMFTAAKMGTLKFLWLQGEDAVQSDPNTRDVIESLEQLDFLVVQDLFLNETTPWANLVLPASCVHEEDGTFTNGERRIQRVRASVAPPGDAKSDWWIFQETARALGADWHYEHPSEVMDEIAKAVPRLFGGVSYQRLEGDGLQWPCPHKDHPGTATVHASGFLRGKGLLTALRYLPSPEQTNEQFPLMLITGRVLHHYNVGSMTRRTPQLAMASADVLEMNPADAGLLEDGTMVTLRSQWGTTSLVMKRADRVAPGTVFCSFHHPETGINKVTGPHTDPQSKCPQYKATAVSVTAVP